MLSRADIRSRGRVSPRLANHRCGMTLTELLVVIMIMSLLLGISLPMMRTAVQDRALREASRQLNTYVQLARARAAERGRPVGLWLETERLPEGLPPDTLFSQQLFLAETPPPYSGDMVGATMKIFENSDAGIPSPYVARTVNPSMHAASTMLPNLVRAGDRIKFDFKGPAYRIDQVFPADATVAGPRSIYFSFESHQPEPRIFDPDNPNVGLLQYQVFRSPQRSAGAPMAFSGDAVIDLSVSGIGLHGLELGQAMSPIVIMFSPTGSIDHIYGDNLPTIPPGTVHLLVGSLRDMMEPGEMSGVFGEDYNRNLEETANMWVSIGHQSGSVVTAQNAWEVRADFSESLAAAREFSEQRFAIGGR